MEIIFNNNEKYTIQNKKILGIYTKDSNVISSIFINNKPLKNIHIIDKKNIFFTSKVLDEFGFYLKLQGKNYHNYKDKINQLLEVFNLDKSILKRIIHSLSTTEKLLIRLIINLINDPECLILDNIFDLLDNNNTKKIIKYLISTNINIVIISNDSNFLYNNTEELLIFKNQKVLIKGLTNEIYQNVELLLKNDIEVPDFSLLTYKANNYHGANLFYRKDVRDVMKDVYKSVS